MASIFEPRLWLAAVATSIAAFLYYMTVLLVARAPSLNDLMLVRAIAAVVIGFLLTIRERQRPDGSLSAAAAEAFGLGVVVVVTNSLMGSDVYGRELAVRTFGILVGTPGLALLARLLGRTRTASPA